MKVLILNTSDARGGAAVVSHRLMEALCCRGVDAKMIVVERLTDDLRVAVAGTPEERKMAFLRERLGIFLANGFNRRDLFKVSTARYGVDVLSHPWLKEADVVCLNWINQGMLSLSAIRAIADMGKKIIWTMHDMWCCTGVCHHAYDCNRYERQCGNCPFMRMPYPSDISRRTWKRKRRLYTSADIHFVAVSRWLAQCCRNSGLLSDKKISVIPNALPVDRFAYERRGDKQKTVVAMGAARLDDPVKGFDILIDATKHIVRQRSDSNIQLLLFGTIRNEQLLSQLQLPYRFVGAVDGSRIPEIMTESDIVVSSSHFETLPTTLIEGQAAGCLAVAFNHGGQADIINHLTDGYLAEYPDAVDLARGILWAADHKGDVEQRKMRHESVARRFSPEVVADAYLHLF